MRLELANLFPLGNFIKNRLFKAKLRTYIRPYHINDIRGKSAVPIWWRLSLAYRFTFSICKHIQTKRLNRHVLCHILYLCFFLLCTSKQ